MPIRNYPFSIVAPDPTQRPMLWIKITNPAKNLSFIALALVDTGADDCLFPAQTAQQLGHNLTSVVPKEIGTAGNPTTAYPHTSRVDILEIRPDGTYGSKVLHTIPDTLIDFAIDCECFLLGTKTFLNSFILEIDYPRKVFSIVKPPKA